MAAPGASDFFLLQQDGKRLAGNLAPMPPRTGILTCLIRASEPDTTFWASATFIAPGLYVFSGSDLYHACMARQRRFCTPWSGCSPAPCCWRCWAAPWSAAASCSRTDAIARACRAIMDGDLKTRIPAARHR